MMFKSLLRMLLACFLCPISSLFAQGYFCSTSIETPDCFIGGGCATPNLPCEIDKRYSLITVPWTTTDPYFDLTEGPSNNSNCDETYYFEVKMSADDNLKQLNGERSIWSYDDEYAIHRGSSKKAIQFYDKDGTKIETLTQGDAYDFDKTDFYVNADPSIYTGISIDKWSVFVHEIRWHPTEHAILYTREIYDASTGLTFIRSELVKRSVIYDPVGNTVDLGVPSTLFYFPGYRLGDGIEDYKLAGGDGNDIHGGRFLLSLYPAATPSQIRYAIVDFNAGSKPKLVRRKIANPTTLTYAEIFYGQGNWQPGLFPLDAGAPASKLDYATISASGLFIVGRYWKEQAPLDGDEGVYLFDLGGRIIQREVLDPILGANILSNQLYVNRAGHIDVGFFRTSSGEIKECILAFVSESTLKYAGGNSGDLPYINGYITSANVNNKDVVKGDVLAIHWDISTTTATPGNLPLHTANYSKVLDWDDGITYVEKYAGSTFSLVSNVQTAHTSIFTEPAQASLSDFTFRALLNMGVIDPSPPAPVWARYYGEIVELSLDQSDPVPRRIVHHRLNNESGLAGDQPESFFSRKGDRLFFRTNRVAGQPTNDTQNLLFLHLPIRTCKGTRDTSPVPRKAGLPSNHHFSLYPNPLSQTDQLLIDCGPEVSDAPQAVLRLISLDGRSSQVWTGTVEAGVQIQAQLTELSSGVYVAELWDMKRGVSLMREKVLLK